MATVKSALPIRVLAALLLPMTTKVLCCAGNQKTSLWSRVRSHHVQKTSENYVIRQKQTCAFFAYLIVLLFETFDALAKETSQIWKQDAAKKWNQMCDVHKQAASGSQQQRGKLCTCSSEKMSIHINDLEALPKDPTCSLSNSTGKTARLLNGKASTQNRAPSVECKEFITIDWTFWWFSLSHL